MNFNNLEYIFIDLRSWAIVMAIIALPWMSTGYDTHIESREAISFNGEEMTEREFAQTMNVSATPTILFIYPQGEVIAHQIGYNPVDRFEVLLQFINSDHFGEVSFEEYFENMNMN